MKDQAILAAGSLPIIPPQLPHNDLQLIRERYLRLECWSM